MNTGGIVGTSVPRLEGRGKVTGEAQYVDDMVFAGNALRCDRSQPDSARKNQKVNVRPRHRLE